MAPLFLLKKFLLSNLIGKVYGKVLSVEKSLNESKEAILPVVSSPRRFEIPFELLNLLKKGVKKARPGGFPLSLPFFIGSIRGLQKGLSISSNQQTPKTSINHKALHSFRKLAYSLDISAIGFTKVIPEFIFQNCSVLYENAIILVKEMDKKKLSKAPSMETGVMVFKTYHSLGKTTNKLAEYLQDLGYNAQPGHPLGGQVLYPALAEKANLGYHGFHGLLVTPEHGPGVRIAAIFTDIANLPISQNGNPHKWVEDFCSTCQKCIRRCPGKAIHKKPISRSDYAFECINSEKCFNIFAEQHGCSVCIKECPFNIMEYENIYRKFALHHL